MNRFPSGDPSHPVIRRLAARGIGLRPVDTSRLPALYPAGLALLALHVQLDVRENVLVRLPFRCDQDCVFCNVQEGSAREVTFLDPAAAGFVIDTLLDPGRTMLDISGGEPLLFEATHDLIRSAVARGVLNARLQTNGVALARPGVVERLVAEGLTGLFVSLHAHTPELSQRITRGAAGQWAKTVAGLHRAMSQGLQTEINVVLCRENIGQAEQITQFLLAEFPELTETARDGFPHAVCLSVANPYGRPELLGSGVLVPFDEAAEPLNAAFDLLRSSGVAYNNPSCGAPFCVVPGHVDVSVEYLLTLGRRFPKALRHDKGLLPICQTCAYAPICFGPWTGYAELFGERGLKPQSTAAPPLALTDDQLAAFQGEDP